MHNFDITFTKPQFSRGSEERRCKTTYSFNFMGELVQIKEVYLSLGDEGEKKRGEKVFYLKNNYSDQNKFIFESDSETPDDNIPIE